jgi:hypothetical protein
MTVKELEENLKNRFWRLNNLYWIVDRDGIKVKFKMNYVQYILYKSLWWLNIVLKSRQHGVTTFACIFALDLCLFTPNVTAGIVCHKLKASQRIFETKIKYVYNNLPQVLKDRIEPLSGTKQDIFFKNNSCLYVDTSMRSDRLQFLHVSEYDYICQHDAMKAAEIKSGTMETVGKGGFIIIECTAEGAGGDFKQMCTAAEARAAKGDKLTRMDYKFHFFAWFMNPDNQLFEEVEIPEHFVKYFEKVERTTGHKIGQAYRAWYVKKKEVLKELMYKEHPSTSEEAFYAAIEGTILGRQMIAAKEDERIDFVPHNPNYRVYTSWDLGTMHTAIWFWQFIGNRKNLIDFYEDNEGAGAAAYANVLAAKRYNYSGYCTGPDILTSNKKDATGKMVKDRYAELGISFDVIADHKRSTRIGASRALIHSCWFDDRRCTAGIKHLMNYRMKKDEVASTEDYTAFTEEPEHGPACHAADAFGHGALMIALCELNGTVPGGTTKSLAHRKPGDKRASLGTTNLMQT